MREIGLTVRIMFDTMTEEVYFLLRAALDVVTRCWFFYVTTQPTAAACQTSMSEIDLVYSLESQRQWI